MAQMDVGSKKTEGNTIADKLTNRLEAHGSRDMQQKVEDLRYNKIIDQRADLMSKAIDVVDRLELDLRKLEKSPDCVIRTIEGAVLYSGFSDKRFEEIKKLKEKVEKAHKVFDKALNAKEQKDFDDVKQLVATQLTDKKPEKPEGEGGDKSKGEQ